MGPSLTPLALGREYKDPERIVIPSKGSEHEAVTVILFIPQP